MTDVAKLGIEIETQGVTAAAAALDILADAARRAGEAIHSLEGAPHGGISIKVAGTLALIEIKPPAV